MIYCLQAGESRKAGGIIQSESKGSRTRTSDAVRQEKMDGLAQVDSIFALPLPFVLFRLSTTG